jgi:hypothetical protein
MAYCLLLRFDSTGPRPVLLREDEPLTGGDGVRYRFIAETETLAEANEIQQQLYRRIEAREL